MQTGTRISAIGHAAVIALAVFGLPWFGPREREPIRVTDVSFVSEADFEAEQAASQAPHEDEAPATPPRARPARQPEPKPEPEPAPGPEVSAPEAPAQEVAVLAPPPASEAPRIQPKVVTVPPPTAAAPPARPAVRAEPDPTPPSEDLPPAEIPEPVRTPEPAAEPEPEKAAAAPEAVAPTPAPEEVPDAPLALVTSTRPMARPDRPQAQPEPDQAETVMAALKREVENEQRRRAEPVEKPAPKPAVKPVAKPSPEPAEKAGAPSQGTSMAAATSLPSGPPMTGAEKDGLKLAVQRCWNVPAGLRDAQELKVTLAAELNADGSVINASIRMIEPNPAPDARFKSAFDAGRRALIRCSPYTDLPREKYAQWRNIEVVFNPEGMVSW